MNSTQAKFVSPLRYPGGKQKAVAQISRVLPASAQEYREPLVGGASVYFHARTIRFAKRYWINDKSAELISFWRIVQDPTTCNKLRNDLKALRSEFQCGKEIKTYFQQARKEKPQDKYREALLFFFFNRVTFSGTTQAGGFSSAASVSRFTDSSIERLAAMPAALAETQITNFGFEEVIGEEGTDVFIFLDPPYYTAEKLYGRNGSLHTFDHQFLAHCLQNTVHRFLITYDDCDEIRKLYRWANIKSWSLQYGMNNCNLQRLSKIGAELFISNY